MKTKLLSILALLLVAVSGAWAQDTYNVTFKANGNTKVVENVTLPYTFNCDYGDGELDKIIQEFYGLSEGWCDQAAPSSSGSENVTCGIIDDQNHFITVSAPFDGTATVTGSYYDPYTGHFTYSLEITCPQPAPTGVEINETNFPDAKFREFLKGQTYGTDGIITDAEIATVTSMDAPFSDIVSMKGIEYFTALERLICANGKISQLDLTKNTALQELNCNSNQLTTLDLSQNTALVGLFCADNKLTALDLSQNTALKRLLCAKNQLTTLNLSQNTAMEIVECYENKLTTLNLTNNTALQDLKCNANQLTTLNITKCTAMILLECADNKLTELDLTENTKLQSLHCAGNKLTELNLKQNTVLTNLNCSRNQLTALDLTKNTELTDLNCSVNQIKGEAMDALIESLPKNTDETNFYLYVIDGTNNGELNAMTAAQATAVKAKGWTAYAYDGEDWKEYAGPATYSASFTAANAYTIEGGKASVSVDGGEATLDEEGKLPAINEGQTVTITAKPGYKFRKVAAEKEAAPEPEVEFVTFTDGTNTVTVATMNLGATSVADGTSSYGNYYAWGATETFGTVAYTAYNEGTVTATKDGGYSQDNAPYYENGEYTKYTGTSSATLEAADDAVAANMPGYHMPTKAEIQTLYAACGGTGEQIAPASISSGADYAKGIYWVAGATSAVTIGGDEYKANGLLFVQDATHYVFFPAAGYVDGTQLNYAGDYGFYWFPSIFTEVPMFAYNLFFRSSLVNLDYQFIRSGGLPVRPFKD